MATRKVSSIWLAHSITGVTVKFLRRIGHGSPDCRKSFNYDKISKSSLERLSLVIRHYTKPAPVLLDITQIYGFYVLRPEEN